MREKDLPFDRSKHAIYSKKAKKCVQTLLRRYYDEPTAAQLWEKAQLQYCAFLEDEPALGGIKMTASIYDPILIFAWYAVIPDKPPLADVQQDVFNCFMGGFDALGKLFNLNRRLDNRIANLAFKKAADQRVKEIGPFPASFRMQGYTYDRRIYPMPERGVRQAPPHGGRAACDVQLRPPGHAKAARDADPGGDLLYL